MKNIIIKINSDNELDYPCKGFLLGLDKFSICFGKTYSVNDIINIKNKYNDKKIFVSLNRPIYNSELKAFREVLNELDVIGIDGLIVGDIAPLTYNLKTPIILDQLHLNNSYLTVNHYINNGVKGIVLTNDITKEEINTIKEHNKDAILFKQVFGLVHLSTSVRSLVTNYFKYFNIDRKDKVNLIKEKVNGKYYHIIEDYYGTHILSDTPLNLLSELDNINADYFIIDSYLLNDDYSYVVDSFINDKIDNNDKINEIYNANKGFIDKKTIYKVKKND